MKKNYSLLWFLLISLVGSACFGQGKPKGKISDWRALSIANHQPGNWLVGAGPTLLGATVKAGRFVANHTWLGLEAEVHSLFSDRQEVGLFGRYYLWNGGLFSGFTELGVSYGRFQQWDWDFDNQYPPVPVYRSPKVNLALGLECPVGRRIALEGVAKIGRLTDTRWLQPSFQGSINLYIGR